MQHLAEGAEALLLVSLRRSGQVVDADAGDGQQDEGGVLGVVLDCDFARAVDQGETGTRPGGEGAYGAAALPQAAPGHAGLDLAVGVVAGLFGAGPGLGAGGVVALQLRGVGACGEGLVAGVGGDADADAALALVVVAELGDPGGGEGAALGQGLYTVLFFYGAGALEADAPASENVGAAGVFGAGFGVVGVGKQHELVACGGAGVFFEAPGQAFFGQQAADEGQVGFAVLHAVAAGAGRA